MTNQEEPSSSCSSGTNLKHWGSPNKGHMEKSDIISLVGKNRPRDSNWGPDFNPGVASFSLCTATSFVLVINNFYGQSLPAVSSSRAAKTCGKWIEKKLRYMNVDAAMRINHNSPKRRKI